MDDNIEKRLCEHLDNLLNEAPIVLDLSFKRSKREASLNVFWDTEKSCWDCKDIIDPLSLLIITERPERERRGNDDNEVVATLGKCIGRRPEWVHSFQCGWFGETNQTGSISGYLLGNKLRRKYLKLSS